MLRVIARMNIGGPAYHVSLLSGRIDRERYATVLAHGAIGAGEASFEDLAAREGCTVAPIATLGPEVQPISDLRALLDLARIVRRFRPDIVHTHTAKAGTLGRLAASIAVRPRPLVVHTYHGHVLEGHFGPAATAVYRWIERLLARVSDRLVGVSEQTVDDLVRLGIAPRESFRVVRLGLDLERFKSVSPASGEALRREIAVDPDDLLVSCVCRLVPHKNVDLLIRAIARVRESRPKVKLMIVGDGAHRHELERLVASLELDDAVTFVGYMQDVAPVAAASDIAALTSYSDEGTPVSLIEAAAAGVPAIVTDIGGCAEVVIPETGFVVDSQDEDAVVAALERLTDDPGLRAEMGARARLHVEGYRVERLLADIDALYSELLSNGR